MNKKERLRSLAIKRDLGKISKCNKNYIAMVASLLCNEPYKLIL